MKPITNEDIKVLGRIVNISTENVVADASQVWDSKQEKDQETINKELVSKTDLAKTDKYGIVRLAENISDPDNDDVVTMRVLNAAINNLINDAPGTLDTLRELAESISSDPNFYTTVRNWINAESNRLGGRIDALEALYRSLESRVGDLEACCEQVQAYMLQYKIKCGNAAILIPVSGIDSDGGIRHGRDVVFTYTTPEYTEDGNSVVAVYTGTGNALPVTKDSNNRYVISGQDIISNITVYPQYEITNTVVQVNYRYTPGKNNVYNPISWSNTSNSSYILGQAYERVFGGSSEITFLTNQGFVLDNVTATMEGGGTITVTKNQDGSYRVYTSKVTGRITMTEYLSSTEHSITVNKTGTGNVGLSGNVPSTIYHKAPFSKYIDERSNVAVVNSITVTMGGIDITSSAVGERHTVGSVSEIPLTIDSVTDDVVITIDSTATSTPVTYGTVTVSPDHGTASPASFSADGTSHTITITPASGYTTTGMTATTTNNDLTVSVSGNIITVTGTSSNNATINVTVPTESTPEDQNVNRGNMYVTFVNAKSPDRSVRPVSTTASSFTMDVEPPYDTMTTTSERDLWEYDMTISVKDIDGNEYVTYDTTDTSDFYKITGLHTASYNQPAILSGSGVSGTIRPSTSRNTIGFESISSNKDLYITITYQDSFSNTGDTTFYTYLGKNQRNGASYNREWFSFNALGKYTNPLIPYDIKSFDDSEESSYTCVYGDPTYGEASRSINIGNISSISGLTGSTDSEKLTDLQTKISYLFVKKAGISNGSDVYYDDYRHLETSENGCPFAVSNVSLDSNSNVILTITCAAADPTAGVATETFESVTFRTSDASDVVTWNMTTTDQHLKGSYHVSQLLVLCGDSVIYSERLCREIYGFINCYPNTSSGPVATNGVWHGVGYYFLQPMNAFTAKSGYNTLPDLSIAINNHGTSTDAGINLTYNDDGTITDPTMIGGSYVDISMTASPVNNTYPSLTSTYNNFRRVNGIELIINGVPPTFS